MNNHSKLSPERKMMEVFKLIKSGVADNRQSLKDILDVSERTISNYVRDLNTIWKTDIEYDPSFKKYIIYDEGDLKNIRAANLLTSEDIMLILYSILQAKPFNPSKINLIQSALLNLLTKEEQKNVKNMIPNIIISDIQDTEIYENIKIIYLALVKQKKLSIQYKSHDSTTVKSYVINPYSFACDFGKYYLICKTDDKHEFKHLRIDRIKSVYLSQGDTVIPSDFDIESYLKKTWYMHHGVETRVKVKFVRKAYKTVTERNMVDGKVLEENDDWFIYEFTCNGIEGIKIWLMGFGSEAEVLEPLELRDNMIKAAHEMCKIYNT